MSSTSTTEERMSLLNRIWYFLTTSFGASTLPGPVPGTYGTVPAVAVWLLLTMSLGWDMGSMLLVTAAAFLFGLFLARWAETHLESHDDPKMTWDEMIGFFVAALIAPQGWWLVLAFVLFRYFDMVKPFPVSWFDRGKGAFWIMFDDVVGGAIAGGFTLWIHNDPAEGVKWFALYVAASMGNRLWWRRNRQKLLKWGHQDVPQMSLFGALSAPVSAWPKWSGG